MRIVHFFIVGLGLTAAACSGNSVETEEQNYDQLPVDSEFSEGKEVYDISCVNCHMKDGKGLENTFPPLAGSDYLLADPIRALKQVKYGSSEKMTVNGIEYEGIMPPQELNDQQIVDVVNYCLNAWGNNGGKVSMDDMNNLENK